MSALSAAENSDADASLAIIRKELQALYLELDSAVARLAPVCELSGRCCRFREYGHMLFLSEPEARLLIADAPAPSRDLDDGQSCPWQDAQSRCAARSARPLGCRVYFCDPGYTDHAPAITEQFLGKLKRLVERYGWPWNYAPLHHHLRLAQESGLLPESIGSSPGGMD